MKGKFDEGQDIVVKSRAGMDPCCWYPDNLLA